MDFVSVAYAMGVGGQGGAQTGGFGAFVPIILMFAIFYFLLIRPQQKKQKEHRQMLANLKRDDLVITQGGLQGKITNLTDTVVTLEIAEVGKNADKVRVKVHRGYIAGLVREQTQSQ
ncbi:MAG TPA: preprotein translocase subunit YajC [Deltaproteobacteria bacterium]|nr:preprotein translocase subunit YajC [Deltaproteobacteria bacterium]